MGVDVGDALSKKSKDSEAVGSTVIHVMCEGNVTITFCKRVRKVARSPC